MYNLKIVRDCECPNCASMGRDSKGNHLIVFENQDEEQFAKCNRCGYYVKPEDFDPDKFKGTVRKEKTAEQVAAEMAELNDCPIQPLPTRKIREPVAERFGVRVGLDPLHGEEVVNHLYPKTREGQVVSYKVRNLEPKFFYHLGGKSTDCELFGLAQAQLPDTGDLYLWIFEDELSCMSGYQVLDEYSKTKNKPACVALPDGTDSATRAVGEQLEWINKFKTVVLCMDADKAGQKAVEAILALIPHAKVVELPALKSKKEGIDANDYLMNNKGRELFNFLLFRQEAPKIEGIITMAEVMEEALAPPEWGLSYPWDELTQLTYGQRYGEIVGVGGGVGCGKTLLAHEIAAHNWRVHGEASFMVMLEENNGKTVKNVAGKIDSIPYHLPDKPFDVEQLQRTAEAMEGGIHLWRSSINQAIRFDFDRIVSAVRYHAAINNVRHVFFDNITAATQHLTPSEINTEVGRIAMTLAGLADELDLQIFIFSHLNTPSSGPSHEEGGQVREFQFTGSRALMRWCQCILGFERNKQADGDAKHRSRVRLLKQRDFGTTGVFDTAYTPDTGRLLSAPEAAQTEEDF